MRFYIPARDKIVTPCGWRERWYQRLMGWELIRTVSVAKCVREEVWVDGYLYTIRPAWDMIVVGSLLAANAGAIWALAIQRILQ